MSCLWETVRCISVNSLLVPSNVGPSRIPTSVLYRMLLHRNRLKFSLCHMLFWWMSRSELDGLWFTFSLSLHTALIIPSTSNQSSNLFSILSTALHIVHYALLDDNLLLLSVYRASTGPGILPLCINCSIFLIETILFHKVRSLSFLRLHCQNLELYFVFLERPIDICSSCYCYCLTADFIIPEASYHACFLSGALTHHCMHWSPLSAVPPQTAVIIFNLGSLS